MPTSDMADEGLLGAMAAQLPLVALVAFDAELCVTAAVGEGLADYGIDRLEAMGRWVPDLIVAPDGEELRQLCRAALGGMRRTIRWASEDGARRFELWGAPVRRPDTGIRAGMVLLQAISAGPALEWELRRDRARLELAAAHDELTGLPGRAFFHERVSQALVRSRRSRQAVHVLFIDLDRFKPVNDVLGHAVGDRLLRAVATTMRAATRSADTVARLGGDEFGVLVEGDANVADGIVWRIHAALSEPLRVGEHQLLVEASIGCASPTTGSTTAEQLIEAADHAMYAEKGVNGVARPPTSSAASATDLLSTAELRQAIRRDELELHYQPAMDATTGAVTTVEALVRWRHPRRGLLLPADFIPQAEHAGRTTELTTWVLAEACRQMRAWRDAGSPVTRIAVNAGSRDVGDGLVDLVEGALQHARLPGDALEIEITERILNGDDNISNSMLEALKDLGVTVAIDDFGTGYSSLARLDHLPVDVLKMDRSFIAGLGQSTAIPVAILELGHQLHLVVHAEGVETAAQLDWLRAAGCDLVSGWHLAPPQPAADLTAQLGSAGR